MYLLLSILNEAQKVWNLHEISAGGPFVNTVGDFAIFDLIWILSSNQNGEKKKEGKCEH